MKTRLEEKLEIELDLSQFVIVKKEDTSIVVRDKYNKYGEFFLDHNGILQVKFLENGEITNRPTDAYNSSKLETVLEDHQRQIAEIHSRTREGRL